MAPHASAHGRDGSTNRRPAGRSSCTGYGGRKGRRSHRTRWASWPSPAPLGLPLGVEAGRAATQPAAPAPPEQPPLATLRREQVARWLPTARSRGVLSPAAPLPAQLRPLRIDQHLRPDGDSAVSHGASPVEAAAAFPRSGSSPRAVEPASPRGCFRPAAGCPA